MEQYNKDTKSLIEKYLGKPLSISNLKEQQDAKSLAADELVELVKNGEIWFPFRKFYIGDPYILFNNLKNINLPVLLNDNYKLYSYHPKYSTYLPPRFRGVGFVIASNTEIYETVDALSDIFIEDIRLQAKRSDQKQSILGCWTQDDCLKRFMMTALNKSVITPRTLRDSIYETEAETKVFNPSWARSLILNVMGTDVEGKKWLDISAGWGDRLLAAMSLNMDYTGYDPNVNLQPGHSQMITLFGDSNRHRVIYEPFETAQVYDPDQTGYDVVMTSPPYYTIEEYEPGQIGQSIVSYSEFNQWMVYFMFAALTNAWKNLKEGGYLILHLGDSKTVHTAEATNIFIENYLPGSSWEGIIGLQGESAYPRPVWVWKKDSQSNNKWEPQGGKALPFSKRTLFNTYPELQGELSNYYGSLYAPNFNIKRTNNQIIKNSITQEVNKKSEEIDKIFNDDLLLASVLEAIGSENIIIFGKAMVDNNVNPKNYVNKYSKNYEVKRNNAQKIRDFIASKLNVKLSDVNIIIGNDLLITSLIESIGLENTVKFGAAMVKYAFIR